MKSYILHRPDVGDQVHVLDKPWICGTVSELDNQSQIANLLQETLNQPPKMLGWYPWSQLVVTKINFVPTTHKVGDIFSMKVTAVKEDGSCAVEEFPNKTKCHVAFTPETNVGHLASTNFRKAQGYVANPLEPTAPEPCLYQIRDRVKCLRASSSHFWSYGTIVERMGLLWACHEDAKGEVLLALGPLSNGLSPDFERLERLEEGNQVLYPRKPLLGSWPTQILGVVRYQCQGGKYAISFGRCTRDIFPEFLTAITKED